MLSCGGVGSGRADAILPDAGAPSTGIHSPLAERAGLVAVTTGESVGAIGCQPSCAKSAEPPRVMTGLVIAVNGLRAVCPLEAAPGADPGQKRCTPEIVSGLGPSGT